MADTDPIEVHCEIRARSELAIMIYDGQKTVWIPRSEIVAMTVHGEPGSNPRATLTIPAWLATEKSIFTGHADVDTLDLFGGAE